MCVGYGSSKAAAWESELVSEGVMKEVRVWIKECVYKGGCLQERGAARSEPAHLGTACQYLGDTS